MASRMSVGSALATGGLLALAVFVVAHRGGDDSGTSSTATPRPLVSVSTSHHSAPAAVNGTITFKVMWARGKEIGGLEGMKKVSFKVPDQSIYKRLEGKKYNGTVTVTVKNSIITAMN